MGAWCVGRRVRVVFLKAMPLIPFRVLSAISCARFKLWEDQSEVFHSMNNSILAYSVHRARSH
jgi:hypothetical protein